MSGQDSCFTVNGRKKTTNLRHTSHSPGKKGDAAAGWIFHSDFLQHPQSWNKLNSAVLLSFYLLQLSAELHLTNLHIYPLEDLQMLR